MISFIVPAYNEERLLGATLDALRAAALATGEPYELIVADDASTDRTAAIAAQHGAIAVSVAHRQIAATRNSGARKANGDWLIFVDADTLVSEAVVRSAVEALRSGAVGGGAAVEFDGTVPLYARLLLPVLVRSFRWAGLAAGCFLFCTRHAFAAVGGFDEAFYGAEELVMSRALKRQGRFVVLRQAVITSGRKLRTHSVREMLAILARLALRGPGAVKQRQGMDLWYAERREDPQQDALTGRLHP
jgi:glycosyltransferase involved in cell wall biosynthesis